MKIRIFQNLPVIFTVLATAFLFVVSACFEYNNPLDPAGNIYQGTFLNDIDPEAVSITYTPNSSITFSWNTINDYELQQYCIICAGSPGDLSHDNVTFTTENQTAFTVNSGGQYAEWFEYENLYFQIGYYTESEYAEYTENGDRIIWSNIFHYPTQLSLYAPMDGGVGLELITDFFWADADHVTTQTGWDFQYSVNVNSPENEELSWGPESFKEFDSSLGLFPGDTVYWRIRARSLQDDIIPIINLWSETYSFTVKSSLEIGDLYAGGSVFYLNGGNGMCAAPRQSALAWGETGVDINGADPGNTPEYTAIGTGASNTATIASALSSGAFAAGVCQDLVYNGYDDWFLPSQDEMIEMESTRADNNLGIGDDVLWTSTEIDADYAYSVVTWGADSNASKDSSQDFFPVRSFTY